MVSEPFNQTNQPFNIRTVFPEREAPASGDHGRIGRRHPDHHGLHHLDRILNIRTSDKRRQLLLLSKNIFNTCYV